MSIDDQEKTGLLFALLLQENPATDNRGQNSVIGGEDPEAGMKLQLSRGGLFYVSMLDGHYLPPVIKLFNAVPGL